MQRRDDIQGLRAVAVLAVLLFHINKQWLPGGFIGVDIFFVISGYLISSIILKDKEKGSFSLSNFYLKRIQRIVPAYFVLLTITSILVFLFFIYTDVYNYRKSLFWSAIFNSNNYFSSLDTYFGANLTENPLLHTWTLSIEMQFYLILPLLLMLFSKKVLKILIPVILVLSLAYCQYHISNHNKSVMYFSLLARSGEFLIGVFLGLNQWKLKGSLKSQNTIQILGFLLIVISAALITETSIFPGLLALVPCTGAALLLLPADRGWIKQLLASRPMVYIGELSYSIYLWHWPVLALMRYHYMRYHLNPVEILLALVFIAILAWLSYNFVETYFRKKIDLKMITTFLSLTIVVGICAVLVSTRMSQYPKKYISPSAIGRDSHAQYYKSDKIRGNLSSGDTILLLGDSHAFILNTFLEKIGQRNNFCFRSVTNDAYPTIPGISNNDIQGVSYQKQYNFLIEKVNANLFRSKIIIFTMEWENNYPSMTNALENFMKNLREDQHLILLTGYPTLNVNPMRVSKGISKSGSSGIKFETKISPIPITIQNIANKYSHKVSILDLTDSDAFKDAPYYKDTVMYYDKGHLNAYGSEVYANFSEKKFTETFEKAINATKRQQSTSTIY